MLICNKKFRRVSCPPIGTMFAICIAIATGSAQTYTRTVFAGSAQYPPRLGDGGPASDAMVLPTELAVDSSGNLYVLETSRHRIRKVSRNGVITTVAGTIPGARGFSMDSGDGFSGDGGPATNARLSSPMGIAVDVAGNLYIADTGNSRIRRVSLDGVITTVAGNGVRVYSGERNLGDGGPATAARLNDPRTVAVDGSGNLYIGEGNGARLRKVTPDGMIATVAGNGYGPGMQERINGPATQIAIGGVQNVAVDAAGNVYMSDTGYSRIRKLSANGMLTTLIGNPAPGRNAAASQPTQIKLRAPTSLAVDSAGYLYVVDFARVSRIAPDGSIATMAGNGEWHNGSTDPNELHVRSGIALNPSGTRMFVADEWQTGAKRITLLTAASPTAAEASRSGKSPAPAPPDNSTANEIRSLALAAITGNQEKFKDLFYVSDHWAEFRAANGATLVTPHVRFHLDMLAGHAEPVEVFDGWQDRSPIADPPSQRILPSDTGGEPPRLEITRALLGASRRLTVDGIEADNGGRAYIVASAPASGGVLPADSAERCAFGMTATMFIDAETYFPIRVDAVVTTSGRCSSTGNMPLDEAGTREQWHFMKLQRKDPCGSIPKEIWVMDQAASFSRIRLAEYRAFAGQPAAERPWKLDPSYVGGVFTNRTLRSNFRIFVTGACIRFGSEVEAPSIESVHSTIQFDLRDSPFRETRDIKP